MNQLVVQTTDYTYLHREMARLSGCKQPVTHETVHQTADELVHQLANGTGIPFINQQCDMEVYLFG